LVLVAALALAGQSLLSGQVAGQTPSRASGANSAHQTTLEIPVGTILPVRINRGFSSKSAKNGQVITGRVMQSVPLPGGSKIPEGAKVIGAVVSASPAGTSGGARMSIRFDRVETHRRTVAIVTDLRALASMVEVEYAEIPEVTPDFGTPYVWATTRQIGGDVKYGAGSAVTDLNNRTVGTGLEGGVLVHPQAKPETKCRGALNAEDGLQALWVFSADACGVYGMRGTTILHAGRTEPVGEIVLAAESGEVKVHSGSGALLRVVR
jgi:hypothetical protein